MKYNRPEQLSGAHLYLDIAKSGYLFHGFSGAVQNWRLFQNMNIPEFCDYNGKSTMWLTISIPKMGGMFR